MKETIEMYLYLIFVFDTERMFPTMREPIETNMSDTYMSHHICKADTAGIPLTLYNAVLFKYI